MVEGELYFTFPEGVVRDAYRSRGPVKGANTVKGLVERKATKMIHLNDKRGDFFLQ